MRLNSDQHRSNLTGLATSRRAGLMRQTAPVGNPSHKFPLLLVVSDASSGHDSGAVFSLLPLLPSPPSPRFSYTYPYPSSPSILAPPFPLNTIYIPLNRCLDILISIHSIPRPPDIIIDCQTEAKFNSARGFSTSVKSIEQRARCPAAPAASSTGWPPSSGRARCPRGWSCA